jgi:hypothetical protein
MKELRFEWKRGVWRVAFAFRFEAAGNPACRWRQGRLRPKAFYKRLIAIADRRFGDYLTALSAAKGATRAKEISRGKKS